MTVELVEPSPPQPLSRVVMEAARALSALGCASIRTTARQNVIQDKNAMITAFKAEIEDLRRKLAAQASGDLADNATDDVAGLVTVAGGVAAGGVADHACV